MKRRKRSIEAVGMSFLDVICCALGGTLLLLLLSTNKPEESNEGFVIPIALVFKIEWENGRDIDLWIKEPDGKTGFVYHNKPRGKIGSLMRDSIKEGESQWEAYFAINVAPGVYEFYAHHYDRNTDGATLLNWEAALFPGSDKEESIVSQVPVRLTQEIDGKPYSQNPQNAPGRKLGRFEVKEDSSGVSFVLLDN